MGEEVRWILGFLGSFAIVASTIWWKVESKQDKKIDDLKTCNSKDHDLLHRKIDKTRDKLEEIWKHLVKEGNRR
jgi:uroporphyrinogen-III decarboxylase